MNVYQMSMVSVMGLCIAMVGIGKLIGDSVYPFVIGLAVCIAFLVQAVRTLQKQIDELKSPAGSRSAEEQKH
jgi:uncharacterized membrane protein YqgA involved in biofilm formation